jgi:hypothetical protein
VPDFVSSGDEVLLKAALGEVPDRRVEMDFSARVADGEEIRTLVFALLEHDKFCDWRVSPGLG